ncbi:dTDP-4-dehydrorhamnose 3,5-epimerase family protein [Pseudonocardia kujensis]|uniref:dTDP-4-dehydrorhamnose 3,5-epimerase family protein n=1 Tax=Pseudonocardia kujensis TaxID=1128675 RepID=UPI001E4EC2D6|nr:dTDP-4-dehydrorhamnose 3,5-epimerase family protein [Pseudonocardia kujensis]MCE0763111.1 dTDP-4-dehydrorhamnose 3,5-epimerase family protein [Pseudonocardia kujensis]
MRTEQMSLAGVIVFRPTPHHDERGFFTRTFDAAVAAEHGVRAETFLQDSQSRSHRGTIRGLHGRGGRGEAKLVRCARGAVLDVVVDARPESPTFGRHESILLDDVGHAHLYIPPGFLHGFQALSDDADVCYRIDREHDPAEDLAVRFDDPALAVAWPTAPTAMSERDRSAGTWDELVCTLVGPSRVPSW